jgi:hypothetical protein
MAREIETQQYLNEKRTRKLRRRLARIRRKELSKALMVEVKAIAFGEKSRIISMLADAYKKELSPSKSDISLSIPATFSIIDSPEGAVEVATRFAKILRRTRVTSVYLDHSSVTKYDLAASGVLDALAIECSMESRRRKSRVRWRGTYPKDMDVRRFIKALGIVKHLEIRREYLKEDEAKKLQLFDKRKHNYAVSGNPTKADFKTLVVQEFVGHVDACLKSNGKTLTVVSKHSIAKYTGEILDNAEQHAGMVDWTIQGYLDNSLDTPICEIAIFNFGKTIAETLSALPDTSYTRMQIAPYLELHQRSRWFGPSWSENDLLTLIALQGHVSSKNQSNLDTRGNGTIDLIETFFEIHNQCNGAGQGGARMAILSGGTYILFDGTYRLGAGPNNARQIAFNTSNDLKLQPDHRYVRGLGGLQFPGTVISIKFPLASTSTLKVDEPSTQ